MTKDKSGRIRKAVRDRYSKLAGGGGSCCPPGQTCCPGGLAEEDRRSLGTGYSADELQAIPAGANMGLGCGNPQAIARLRRGETVLDLGAGGGLDCFLAARQVGPTGRVIGVDMTQEMVAKARASAEKGGHANVEFRLGEIERLPLPDESVDVILSNCVVNLSPDKPAVYREAFRVLKPGGRLAILDVLARDDLPPEIKNDRDLLCGCVAGAATVREMEDILTQAGFVNIEIRLNEASREFIRDWAPGRGVENYIVSATIEARRPETP